MDAADFPATEGALNLVTMQLPDASSDGTVPESSARALKLPPDTRRIFCIGDKGSYKAGRERRKSIDTSDFDEAFFDRAHEPIFKSASAQTITFTAIENICRKEIKRRLGIPG